MKDESPTIRVVMTAGASLAIAIFVQCYGLLQANWLRHAHQLSLAVLPLPTAFYHRYALAGYLLPIAAALLLLIKSREAEGRAVRVEVLLRLVELTALVWALGAILAWQLPLYVPDAPVK